MSTMGGGSPPSLTTIDALLSLAEFVSSPDMIARVQELRDAEAAAKSAQDLAEMETARAKSLLDEHAVKVRNYNEALVVHEADKAALKKAQDLHNRKVAKMREAENLR